MAKDILGNIIKVGDRFVFNNMVCLVKDLKDNRVIGAKMVSSTYGQGMKIPDEITLEISLSFDSDKPVNGFVVKTPPELGTAEA